MVTADFPRWAPVRLWIGAYIECRCLQRQIVKSVSFDSFCLSVWFEGLKPEFADIRFEAGRAHRGRKISDGHVEAVALPGRPLGGTALPPGCRARARHAADPQCPDPATGAASEGTACRAKHGADRFDATGARNHRMGSARDCRVAGHRRPRSPPPSTGSTV